MGKFIDKSIKDVISELNSSYFLPDIQREYVWLNKHKERKIELLFDSILRGYPIGSFLFWKLSKNDIETDRNAKENSEKLNFQLYKFIERYDERRPHNEKVNIEQVEANNITIVLDGQQRLTSLYIGLKGSRTLRKPYYSPQSPNAYEERKLFINLRHNPTYDNPDDNYSFEFRNDIPQPDPSNFWFKVGDILNIKSILSYARDNDLSDAEAAILERLKNAICTESLISYFEETDKNLDKVLQIFIRVNSGGTVLSYSDLLMSLLTANFSSDIRGQMEMFVDKIREEGFAVFGRDQILKTSLMLTDSDHIFQLKNFNKGNINKIEAQWEDIIDKILSSVGIVKDLGYQNQLSSAYIITVIAYYLYKHNLEYKNISDADKQAILQFIQNAQITSYFSVSLDSKLSIVIKCMKDASSFSQFNDNIRDTLSNPLRITDADVNDMINVQYGAPSTLPILQILYPHLDYKDSKFHIDHIYPKSRFNEGNKDLPIECYNRANYLFNLQLLEGSINNAKRAKDPEVWLREYFNDDIDRMNDYKKRNYIDETFELQWSNIKDFEEKREKNLLDKLKEIFGFK